MKKGQADSEAKVFALGVSALAMLCFQANESQSTGIELDELSQSLTLAF